MNEKKILNESTKEMQVNLTEEMLEQFMTYKEMLLEYNKNINLTSIVDPKEIMLKHFADCLSIMPYCNFTDTTKIIDVGTGAGFPAVPVKIACPNIHVTLLDSLNKRINFLEDLIQELDLDNVTCIHGRAEDIGKNPELRETFDYAVARAVAQLAVLAEYTLPFVKIGGKLIALKARDAENEIVDSEEMLTTLGGKVVDVIDVVIPFTDLEHKLVIVEKISNTPDKFPRKPNQIKKNK